MIKMTTGFPVYDFINTDYQGFHICFISGMHGNEVSGINTLSQLVNSGYFKYIPLNIRIIPVVNIPGFRLNNRYFFGKDLNRMFGNDNNSLLNQNIKSLISSASLVIDIHDAWGYYKTGSGSIGSTLSIFMHSLIPLCNVIIADLNRNINDNIKKFTLLLKSVVPGTLFEYCYKINKPYILVEITGQDSVQPIHIRHNQLCQIINQVIIAEIKRQPQYTKK